MRPIPTWGRCAPSSASADVDEYLLDRLLVFGVVEARACERFGLLAEGLAEPDLRAFYAELTRAEARHHALFVRLAQDVAPARRGGGAPRRRAGRGGGDRRRAARSAPRCTDRDGRTRLPPAGCSAASRTRTTKSSPPACSPGARTTAPRCTCSARRAASAASIATGGCPRERRWRRVRSGELAASCAALGIAPPAFAELPDGGVGDADRASRRGARRRAPGSPASGAGGDARPRRRLRPSRSPGLDGDRRGRRARLLAADQRRGCCTPVFPRGHFARLYELGRRAGRGRRARPGAARRRPKRWSSCASTSARWPSASSPPARAHDSQLDVAPGSFFRRLFAPLLVEEWYVVAHGAPLPAGASDPFAGL